MTKKVFIFIFLLLFLFYANIVFSAQCTCPQDWECPAACNPSGGCDLPCVKVDKKGKITGGTVTLDNPLGAGKENINVLIGQIINAVLGIVGSLALVMFIFGGFTWMLAAGSPERVKRGKDIIIWAAMGLVVIFSAYALVKFVFTGLGVPK